MNIDGEIPRGVIDGVNVRFTLSQIPNPVSSVKVYRNGLRQYNNSGAGDCVVFLSGTTGVVKFNQNSVPQPRDRILVDYTF